jgi:micrococcal nuclease
MKTSRLLIFLAIIIILIDLAYFYPRLTGQVVKYKTEPAIVTKVLDGDTIEIDNQTRVRLLCINTPEKGKPFYDQAKDFLEQLENQEIEILRDKEDRDRYNRSLRFIFYKDQLINKKILEKGLAHVYLCEGLIFERELEKAEKEARENEEGLWKKSTSKCRNCIDLLELDPVEEFFILKNNCNYPCSFEAKDEANHFFDIDMEAGEQKTIKSKGKVWNNAGDRLFLRDEKGVLFYYLY